MDPRYQSPTANVDIEVEEDFRDLDQFTSVLTWMLRIGALFAAISLFSAFMQLNMLTQSSYSPEDLNTNLLRETGISGLVALFTLATIVVFARWIVLAHRNLPALGARYLEVTPGWAVGWFFVPVVHIWFPYRAMRSLWRASHSAQRPELQDSTWVLPTWWALWLGFLYLPFFTAATPGMRATAGLIAMTQWQIAGRFIGVALCVVASILVSRIWEAQRSQHDNPGEFDPAPGFADA
jgi:hypothetical protein